MPKMSKAQSRKRLEEAKDKILRVFAQSGKEFTNKEVDDFVKASVAIEKLIRKFR